MNKRWYNRIFSISTKDTNLLEVTGSLIVIISFVLPFFEKVYLKSSGYIFGSELIFSCIFKGEELALFTKITLFYIFIIPILVLTTSKRRMSAVASAVGIFLLTLMLYSVPVPIERFSFGIIFLYIGLSIITLGFSKKAP